ncbi:hypothetical protein AAFG13_37300 [Bradyrhizobium sp. B124]|uniref:hypothetical protein n=1 Tax=Bradyrhizobium sp. B124 TaxID=3140245 RepID=UPI003182CCB6
MIAGDMDTISTVNDVKVLEIIDTGRRRRFSVEAMRRIVEEMYSCAILFLSLHGLFPSHLFGWRRLARQGALGASDGKPGFVAALTEPEPGRTEKRLCDDAGCEQAAAALRA